ncbi:MAG: DNA mismatch repair endonuclease MutL [Candidatus Helarchaeales archaeon]
MSSGQKIKLLDKKVINKIAAGEVIENPASVVKELVENSIDAGATSIKVTIRNGGKDFIQVSDDGEGMSREDALLSIQRHATSKLRDIEDLQALRTLGFRGEALSSIAAVSRMQMETNTDPNETGTLIKIEGGKVLEVTDGTGPKGTVIEVRDLFFNVPVRRKYMKSREKEAARIIDVIMNYALIHPEISFKLIHDSKEVLFTPKSPGSMESLTYLETITYVLGKSIAREMVPIKGHSARFTMAGYISKPSMSRKGPTLQFFFVNGRSIKSKLLSSTIKEAYGNLLFPKEHPIVILSFEFDPARIDVNIHPTKKEIRFLDEDTIRRELKEIIQEKLMSMNVIPVLEEKIPQKTTSSSSTDAVKIQKSKKLNSLILGKSEAQKIAGRKSDVEIGSSEGIERLPPLYFVGQFHDTYLLMQDETDLYIIDQHAAAERINYEKLLEKLKSRPLQVQQLISPVTFDLSPKEAKLLKNGDVLEKLKQYGFHISHFGGNTFLIHSVPVVFGSHLDERVILEFIHELEIGKKDFHSTLQDDVIKLLACHSSIRAGEPLSEEKALKLVNDLRKCNNPYSCPHGRPTLIRFSLKFLEKKFKRII